MNNFAQYYNEISTVSSSAAGESVIIGLFAFLLLILPIFLLLTVGVYVATSIALMKIFKKAGVENAWAAWVPVYNNWKLLEIGGQQGFWALLALIPLINIAAVVFMYIAMYNIGLKFGKEGAFILWAIFLPIVWLFILGFDKSVWNENRHTI